MRLTDVENDARRLPAQATPRTNSYATNEGTINAAHLTDAPPYEEQATFKAMCPCALEVADGRLPGP